MNSEPSRSFPEEGQDETRETAGTMGEKARETASAAGDKARQAADTVGDKAREAGDKAQDYAVREADKRSGQAGQWMQKTGHDLRDAGQSMREKGDSTMAGLMDAAANGLETYGSRIQDMDAGEIRDEVAGFVRNNVWAVAAGALFIGLVASRVFRVSAGAMTHDGRERRQYGGEEYGPEEERRRYERRGYGDRGYGREYERRGYGDRGYGREFERRGESAGYPRAVPGEREGPEVSEAGGREDYGAESGRRW